MGLSSVSALLPSAPADPSGDHPTGCHPALRLPPPQGRGHRCPAVPGWGPGPGPGSLSSGWPPGWGTEPQGSVDCFPWLGDAIPVSLCVSLLLFSLPPSGPGTRFWAPSGAGRRGPNAYIPALFLPVALELRLQISVTPPIPNPARPLPGEGETLLLLLEDGNWKPYKKPKFLATCGRRGPSILLSPGPSRSVSPLAPGSWPLPPSAGLPWPPGRARRPPATETALQAVPPLNKRGRGPCAVLLGAAGTAGRRPFSSQV